MDDFYSMEINLPIDIARMICEMDDVCFSEGLGPDNARLMLWIREKYPELKKDFSYLWWAREGKNEIC